MSDEKPKERQRIIVVTRTIFCHQCKTTKEIAQFYCACGSFLCVEHILTHDCMVTAAINYTEELLEALV